MKKIQNIFKRLTCGLLFVSCYAAADSPLTSTNFSAQYEEYEIIQSAEKSGGVLTDEYAAFLTDTAIPLGARMAMINAIGWKFDGNYNAPLFMNYMQTGSTDLPWTQEDFLNNAAADQVIAYAYLMAMGDYFEVDEALQIASQALELNSESLSIHMIHALIQSQVDLDDGDKWCNVYKNVDAARNISDLDQDLKPAAIDSIFEYIDLYKTYCDPQ